MSGALVSGQPFGFVPALAAQSSAASGTPSLSASEATPSVVRYSAAALTVPSSPSHRSRNLSVQVPFTLPRSAKYGVDHVVAGLEGAVVARILDAVGDQCVLEGRGLVGVVVEQVRAHEVALVPIVVEGTEDHQSAGRRERSASR